MGNIILSCSGLLLFPGDVALAFHRVGDEREFTSPAPTLPLHGDPTRK